MATLFSYWLGEAGWFLCFAAPILRHMAEEYDRVVVAADHKLEHLTDDFHDEFVPVTTDGGVSFFEGKFFDDHEWHDQKLFLEKLPIAPPDADIVRPEDLWTRYAIAEMSLITKPPGKDKTNTPPPKLWRKYGQKGPKKADVLYALRPSKFYRGQEIHKNYPEEEAERVVRHMMSAGATVAAIGLKDNQYVEGSWDWRGIELPDLCDRIASSRVVVGPSSFPLHLAQQCGRPVVTWFSPNPKASRYRYAHWWNPLNVSHIFLGEDYHVHPTPTDVLIALSYYL